MRRLSPALVLLWFWGCSEESLPEPGPTEDAGTGTDARLVEPDPHDQHGQSDPHATPYPSCQRIMDLCHPLDQGRPGRIHECHEVAMDAEEDESCAVRLDECVEVCSLGGGDAGGVEEP